MPDWFRRETNVRHIDFCVPMNAPWGATPAETDQAFTAALQEWERLNPGKSPFGDWCRVHADDENIVIRITVEEPAKATGGIIPPSSRVYLVGERGTGEHL